ncbi:twin-arginine translocase subunit TatC [Roseimaritima sediminicola]|uniref:twin-arginine translocase subunit TatC n=1 Tax=Roseimaritima sediminicola TaxID=2662066 RepID=UPI00129825D6|nr:twin-arginine translocase subunit TatC [Roseimaritima sediminicola]
MELPSRPKDSLFDDSTMTFGEHLEELRSALRGAVLWLAIGLGIGLIFANSLVEYVQQPLRKAILTFQADREIARRGLEPDAKQLKPLRQFLVHNSLEIETVLLVPQAPAVASALPTPAADNDESTVEESDELVVPDVAANEPLAGAEPPAPQSFEVENYELPEHILQEQQDLLALMQSGQTVENLPRQVMLRPSKAGLNSHKSEEGFMIWIKAGLMIGAVLASPMIFYHLWGFVSAGLYPHERQYVYVYLPVSVILFTAGVCLAFFGVLYYVLSFLLTFNAGMSVDIQPRLSYYMNFVLLLPLGFGVAFQLPLVMLFLERLGMFTVESYVSSWRIAILVICVASMILTPADVTSMVALAVPLIFLYFLGILMCKYIPRGRGLGSAALDPR